MCRLLEAPVTEELTNWPYCSLRSWRCVSLIQAPSKVTRENRRFPGRAEGSSAGGSRFLLRPHFPAHTPRNDVSCWKDGIVERQFSARPVRPSKNKASVCAFPDSSYAEGRIPGERSRLGCDSYRTRNPFGTFRRKGEFPPASAGNRRSLCRTIRGRCCPDSKRVQFSVCKALRCRSGFSASGEGNPCFPGDFPP